MLWGLDVGVLEEVRVLLEEVGVQEEERVLEEVLPLPLKTSPPTTYISSSQTRSTA